MAYRFATICPSYESKQPQSLDQHLKLKAMHVNTRQTDQLVLQHISVSTNSYGLCFQLYTVAPVWNKFPYDIHNAPSVMSLRKQFKTHHLGIFQNPIHG